MPVCLVPLAALSSADFYSESIDSYLARVALRSLDKQDACLREGAEFDVDHAAEFSDPEDLVFSELSKHQKPGFVSLILQLQRFLSLSFQTSHNYIDSGISGSSSPSAGLYWKRLERIDGLMTGGVHPFIINQRVCIFQIILVEYQSDQGEVQPMSRLLTEHLPAVKKENEGILDMDPISCLFCEWHLLINTDMPNAAAPALMFPTSSPSVSRKRKHSLEGDRPQRKSRKSKADKTETAGRKSPSTLGLIFNPSPVLIVLLYSHH